MLVWKHLTPELTFVLPELVFSSTDLQSAAEDTVLPMFSGGALKMLMVNDTSCHCQDLQSKQRSQPGGCSNRRGSTAGKNTICELQNTNLRERESPG